MGKERIDISVRDSMVGGRERTEVIVRDRMEEKAREYDNKRGT